MMQKKCLIYAMLCICAAFLFSGCGNNEAPENSKGTPNPTKAVSFVLPDNSSSGGTADNIAPLENKEIIIYTLNPENLEKEAVTVLVTAEEEVTPELIAEQVVEAMEDEGFYLGINDIIIEGENVRIDFLSDAVPVVDVGASVEGSIIDILAQSILDNLPQYKKIYISIEGNPYHSGHLEFELDEVYLGR